VKAAKIFKLIRFFRPVLVLLAVFLLIGLSGVAYQGIRTLQRLSAVEADRDRWQRPADVIERLHVKEGSVVVDFGSGVGYFALKLSDRIGRSGEVIAVDLRRFSLLFLHIRAFLQGKHNIRIIVGDPDDPRLAAQTADAVLISNAYHELTDPHSILKHLLLALRAGGRLVVLDQRPIGKDDEAQNKEHHASPEVVENELLQEGFSIESRDDSFVRKAEEQWWLLVATKP
jgi:ubiquinone/menaquinone biosynthesis C-methylase UbiE